MTDTYSDTHTLRQTHTHTHTHTSFAAQDLGEEGVKGEGGLIGRRSLF